jgi:hypothetical protein
MRLSDDQIESLALNKWFDQARRSADGNQRRDCLLDVDGDQFLMWGAAITARKLLENNGATMEKWEFSFDELREYSKCVN